jgi:predicted dehydrogenase
MIPDMKKLSAPLTAAVIGGGAGGRLSLDALQASPAFDLVAAVDIRPEVRKELTERYPGIHTFANHEELFSTCPTEVVCVSTWAPSHQAITQAALALPLRAILVEKPLGDITAAGACILQEIRTKGIPVAVPHGLVVKRCALDILRRVRDGDIGALRLVEMQSPKWDLINAGIHWIQFLMTVAGPTRAERVLCACDTSSRTYRDGMQVETAALTQIDLANGVRGIVMTGDHLRSNGWDESAGATFRLVGNRGTIEFWGWGSSYRIVNAAYPHGEVITPAEESRSYHQRHLENLLPQIESGINDYSLAESSLAALEIIDAAYLSARHHCQVTLPLATFTPPAASDWDPGRAYAGHGGGVDGRTL